MGGAPVWSVLQFPAVSCRFPCISPAIGGGPASARQRLGIGSAARPARPSGGAPWTDPPWGTAAAPLGDTTLAGPQARRHADAPPPGPRSVNLGDVRRLAITLGVAAVVLTGWLLMLGLQQRGTVDVEAASDALAVFALATWLWIGLFLTIGLLMALGITLNYLHQAPDDLARGYLRQVQCQHCKAVFLLHDTGHRPIQQQCPNCRYLGVYDGTAPPVGRPPRPEPARKIVELELSCKECRHHFPVTDTGARPLRVQCPRCDAKGRVV